VLNVALFFRLFPGDDPTVLKAALTLAGLARTLPVARVFRPALLGEAFDPLAYANLAARLDPHKGTPGGAGFPGKESWI